MEVLMFWLVIAILTGMLAANKGRSGFGWFLLGAFFSLPAMFILWLLPAQHGNLELAQVRSGTMKKCPYCAEIIKAEATVCRYCGKDVI